ncbi:IclR family transcriptional regulator [Patescibacteria group bacterium]|nr:IclR family transcriptional regulator [Patescibacteria group bacterium]
MSNKYTFGAMEKALDILNFLAGKEGPLAIREIAKHLNLSKSTVSRILLTLASRDLVQKDELTKKYDLGTGILKLARALLDRMDLRKVARPVLENLRDKASETVFLAVLRKGEVIYLDRVDSEQSVVLDGKIGESVPAHCTALGKAILAFVPKDRVEKLIQINRLQKFTKNTLTEPEKLKEELRNVSHQGHAVDNEESIAHVRCVGAPIFDNEGNVVASITLAGPSFRITNKRIPALARSIKEAARAISKSLGYQSSLNYKRKEKLQKKGEKEVKRHKSTPL